MLQEIETYSFTSSVNILYILQIYLHKIYVHNIKCMVTYKCICMCICISYYIAQIYMYILYMYTERERQKKDRDRGVQRETKRSTETYTPSSIYQELRHKMTHNFSKIKQLKKIAFRYQCRCHTFNYYLIIIGSLYIYLIITKLILNCFKTSYKINSVLKIYFIYNVLSQKGDQNRDRILSTVETK